MEFWKLIKMYDIPTLPLKNVKKIEDAVEFSNQIQYPVVVKIWSSSSHKTDIGGVKLNITNDKELSLIVDKMTTSISIKYPEVDIYGVTIQKMINLKDGIEMICGIKKDKQFGHVILFGLGGIYAELFKDVVFRVVPFHENVVYEMINEINSVKLLQGFRGSPAVDLKNIVDVIMKLQLIATRNPEIEELDINPLLCYSDQVICVDGRVF